MRRLLAYLVLIPVVVVTLVLAGLATPIGRGIVAKVVERAASSDGLTVSIDRLSGWPPFWVGADKITLSDARGEFAEIDDLAIDVSLRRILSGTIAVNSITAGTVSVERAPVVKKGSGGGGTLPPFVANEFSVAALVLGEALAGRRAVLAVEGSASIGPQGHVQAALKANRIDGPQGMLTAELNRADGDAPFAADITIAEAADGILVGLIGRPDGPAYNLSVKAVPDGDAVRGSVTLASNQSAQFNGHFALAPADNAKRLQVTASGDLAELVPPDFAGLLSGSIDIGLDADWSATSGSVLPEISIRKGQLTTATVNASISGTLSREVADLLLNVEIADPSGAPIALPLLPESTELRRVSLHGTVAPSDGIVRADLVGNVTGLDLGTVSVPATGLSLAVETVPGGSVFGGKLPFALRLEADAVRTASGEITATDKAPLLISAEGTIDTETATATADIDLSAAGGSAKFSGNLSADKVAGSASAMFSEVRTLAGLTGRDMSGSIDAKAEGSFYSRSGTDVTISADLTDFDPGQDTLARLMRGSSKVTAGIATNGEGTVKLSKLDFAGQTLDASGEATIGAETVSASIKGSIDDIAPLADNTAGSATFTADISGSRTRPEIDAAFKIAEGELLGRPIRDGIARLYGRASTEGWQGTVTLGGSYAGKPLAGNVEVVATSVDGRFSFPSIDLNIDDNRISGSLERTGDGLVSGTLDVKAPNLATLAALALVEATGSAEARLNFAPEAERQAIAVTFSGKNVEYQSVTAASLKGDAKVEDAFGTPRIDGTVQAATATVGSLHLDTVSAKASVDGNTTSFQVAAKGPDTDLTGTGSLTGDSGVNVLRLDTVSGSAYRVPVKLESPVTIRFDSESPGIPTMRIAVGGGSVVVDGRVSPNLNLTIVGTQVPASVANGFAPSLGAEGTVNARATVTGNPGSPKIAWQADWAGMQTAATRTTSLPALQVSASGSAGLKQTTIDGTVTGAGLSLTFKGNVPFSGSGLAITVAGAAPLSLLALKTTREVRFGGNAQIDLKVSGSLSALEYAGSATLVDATLVDGGTGFGVTGASGVISFDGRTASTERISGRIAQGGQITASGSVDIAAGQLPANLRIDVTNGRYNDGEVVNALFDASLTVNGPLLGGATMSGTIALGRTEIQLPERLAVASTAIDVKHVNTAPGFVPPLSAEFQPAAGPSPTGGLRLDIELTNSGGIFVRGFGVDAEFGGSLRVTNTIANPQAVGAFTMRRGRIELIGRRFELSSGTLTFAGDLTPVVDFTATTSTSSAVVTVHVTGPADDPVITFTSNPAMPEEEILSRLLFDRSVSSLSVVQAAQLLDAAAQFSGVGGGRSFFARIRDAIGVDNLDIRQNAAGGTTVGIGKRINENVSLGVEAGTKSNDGRVTIDLDLTPNLKARGSAGQGGSGSVGLTYEREY